MALGVFIVQRHRRVAGRWLARPGVAITFCALLGVLLPAGFGAINGLPRPTAHDEYSYLLAADTFLHGRLTNPTPPLSEFFEAEHVLISPSYQSKYPPAQALFLAAGQRLFGHPIWGVWITCGLFAASLCWMLQAWTSRRWALAVSLAAILSLGTTTYWAQSYWGGMVAASGASLLLGGLRRTLRQPAVTSSVLLALGAALLANSRPYEGFFLALPAAVLIVRHLARDARREWRRRLLHFVLPAGVILGAAAAWTMAYNRAVTGSPLVMPYSLHQRQYFHQGIFVFSPVRPPQRIPTERVAGWYRSWVWEPARGPRLILEPVIYFVVRCALALMVPFGFVMSPFEASLAYRAVLAWFVLLMLAYRPLLPSAVFALVALCIVVEAVFWKYIAVYPYPLAPVILFGWLLTHGRNDGGSRWMRFIAVTAAIVLAAQAIVALWYPHYSAPLVPLFLAGVAISLQRTARHNTKLPRRLALAVGILLIAQVIALGALRHRDAATARMPASQLSTQQDVKRELLRQGGKHLVFVRYANRYSFTNEWVYNGADLQAAPVVFAHDLGATQNPKLAALYGGRRFWRLEVSTQRVLLEPYSVTFDR